MNQYRIVICSGPTREWVDPVRFMSNPSSGETGYYLAEYAQQHAISKEVVYISGPVASQFQSLSGSKCYDVETTSDMAKALHDVIGDQTIIFMVAAPADFCCAEFYPQKIKKGNTQYLNLQMRPTIDILKSLLPHQYRNFYVVGFAAETNNIHENALLKLKDKCMHLICSNQVYQQRQGFGNNQNTLIIYNRFDDDKKTIGPCNKKNLARQLFEYTLAKLNL